MAKQNCEGGLNTRRIGLFWTAFGFTGFLIGASGIDGQNFAGNAIMTVCCGVVTIAGYRIFCKASKRQIKERRMHKRMHNMTDKQWLQVAEKIMPHLEALIKISEELGTGFSIIVNMDGASDVSCHKNNYGMYIHCDGTCSIRKDFHETIKKFQKNAPISEQEDRGKEK